MLIMGVLIVLNGNLVFIENGCIIRLFAKTKTVNQAKL